MTTLREDVKIFRPRRSRGVRGVLERESGERPNFDRPYVDGMGLDSGSVLRVWTSLIEHG